MPSRIPIWAFCSPIRRNESDGARTARWTIGRALGVELADHPGPFPIGNMFYARAKVARTMREVTQGFQWPREPVAYDGTILHAIERMWPAVCGAAGFEWAAIHSAYDVDARGG